MSTKYVSGRVKELKVGITNYSESKESLSVIGIVSATKYFGDGSTLTGIDVTSPSQLNVAGVSTFGGNIDANGNLDVDGHTELDDVNVSGAITATTFTGNLTGTVNTAAQPNITSLGTIASLVASTAYAGVLEVTGSAGVKYQSRSGSTGGTTSVQGNPFSDSNGITFSGSGDLDNGMTITYGYTMANAVFSSSKLLLDMGDSGVVSFGNVSHQAGISKYFGNNYQDYLIPDNIVQLTILADLLTILILN